MVGKGKKHTTQSTPQKKSIRVITLKLQLSTHFSATTLVWIMTLMHDYYEFKSAAKKEE